MSYPNTFINSEEYKSLYCQLKLQLFKNIYDDKKYNWEARACSTDYGCKYHRFHMYDILNDIDKKSRQQYEYSGIRLNDTHSQLLYKNFEDNFYKSLKKTTQEYFTYYFDKIIFNSEILLLEYDMLDEFKKWDCNNFFSTSDYNSELNVNIISTFIEDVISCCLSQEANIKKKEKYEQEKKLEQEYKEELYREEFKCMILYNKIKEYKYKTEDLYIEYNKILELKRIYNIPKNILFLQYFTPEKIIYLENLLALF